MSGDVPIREAATLLPLRDAGGHLEVCLLRRNASSTWVAGLALFPGGAVDATDADSALANLITLAPGDTADTLAGGLAPWVAALRETYEEIGLLLATTAGTPHAGTTTADTPNAGTTAGTTTAETPHARTLHGLAVTDATAATAADAPEDDADSWAWTDPIARAHLDAARAAVARAAAPFAEVVAGARLTLRIDRMRFIAHWVTPPGQARRYDTRFYIAAVPPDAPVHPDGTEIVHADWMRPADAIAAHEARVLPMLPPTLAALHWLAQFPATRDALAGADALGNIPRLAPGDLSDAARTTLTGPASAPATRASPTAPAPAPAPTPDLPTEHA